MSRLLDGAGFDVQARIGELMRVLPKGKANRMSSGALKDLLGLKRNTDVGAIVLVAREAGHPIASGHTQGYWISDEPQDFRDTAEHLRKRARSAQTNADRMDALADRIEAEAEVPVAPVIPIREEVTEEPKEPDSSMFPDGDVEYWN